MLIKDFCILKLQKNAVLVLLAMCVVFTVFMKSPTYIVNLFPMYGFLLVLGGGNRQSMRTNHLHKTKKERT